MLKQSTGEQLLAAEVLLLLLTGQDRPSRAWSHTDLHDVAHLTKTTQWPGEGRGPPYREYLQLYFEEFLTPIIKGYSHFL